MFGEIHSLPFDYFDKKLTHSQSIAGRANIWQFGDSNIYMMWTPTLEETTFITIMYDGMVEGADVEKLKKLANIERMKKFCKCDELINHIFVPPEPISLIYGGYSINDECNLYQYAQFKDISPSQFKNIYMNYKE